MRVLLYTDGSAVPNPGEGGWAFVLQALDGLRPLKEVYGYGYGGGSVTNNAMELTAVIRGLGALSRPSTIEVISDSQYVIDGMGRGWARAWKLSGGIAGRPNSALWDELLNLDDQHTLTWQWVRGHARNLMNEQCDRLAALARSTRCEATFLSGGADAVASGSVAQ